MSTYLSFIEEYNELLNDHEQETIKEEKEEIIRANEIYMQNYHYRCNPSISRRFGFRL